MKNRNLIFFTSDFPYGVGEAFIENEFPFLLSTFQRILIITNNHSKGISRLTSNKQVEVIYFPYNLMLSDKIKAVKGILLNEFWKELAIIRNQYKIKLNFSIIKTLLSSIQKKGKLADFLELIINKNQWKLGETWLYSYWLNDMALGVAEFKSRNPEIRAFSRAHGWDVYMERHSSKYLPLRRFLIEKLDCCYCISEDGKHYLQNINTKFSAKVELSRLGTMNEHLFVPDPGSNSEKRFTIVSCSNLIPLKRIHLIIEALSIINKKVKWIHFGNGSAESEIKQQAFNKLEALSTIDYVFKGQVKNEELLNFYKTNSIHLFINVSESEGLPVSIMEAMSFGIPCIASNVGGSSEIVNGNNGALLDPNPTAKDLCNVLLKFMEMKEIEYLEFRKNAYSTWGNKYDAMKNYKNFINQILEL